LVGGQFEEKIACYRSAILIEPEAIISFVLLLRKRIIAYKSTTMKKALEYTKIVICVVPVSIVMLTTVLFSSLALLAVTPSEKV
jgi:hypothetical protein